MAKVPGSTEPDEDVGGWLLRWGSGRSRARRAQVAAGSTLVLAVLAIIWWIVPLLLYQRPAPPNPMDGQAGLTAAASDRASYTNAVATTRAGLIVGLAGVVAFLTLRETARQNRSIERLRTSEIRNAQSDAEERRVTELYTKAIELLGATDAPVRLGGLYALERLAQHNPNQRQTIVDVLCAYLRMPFDLPLGDVDLFEPEFGASPDIDQTAREELEVRRAAQRILAAHLRPGPGGLANPIDTFLGLCDVNLTGALLYSLDFDFCTFRKADFTKSTFLGLAWLRGARFQDNAYFWRARFVGVAIFAEARFTSGITFSGATFVEADFDGAKASAQAVPGSDGFLIDPDWPPPWRLSANPDVEGMYSLERAPSSTPNTASGEGTATPDQPA